MSGRARRHGLVPSTPAGAAAARIADDLHDDIAADAVTHDTKGTYVASAHAAMARAGLLGATAPAQLGGLGVTTLHDTAAVLERIAAADASAALVLHMQLSRGLSLSTGLDVPGSGDEARRGAEELLRAMAAGDAFVAGAAAEAGASYFTVTATIERADDGRWVLCGRKIMVTGAPAATHFAVRARIRGADGADGAHGADGAGGPYVLGGALVARDHDGVTVGSEWDGLGMRGSGSEQVRFDAVPVEPWSVRRHGPWGEHHPAAAAGRLRSSAAMLGIYLGIAAAARTIVEDEAARAQRSAAPTACALRTLLSRAEHGFRIAAGVASSVLHAVDAATLGTTIPDAAATGLVREWQIARAATNDAATALADLAATAVGPASYRLHSPVARLLRDSRAGRLMQPYGPLWADEFVAATLLGPDPRLLV